MYAYLKFPALYEKFQFRQNVDIEKDSFNDGENIFHSTRIVEAFFLLLWFSRLNVQFTRKFNKFRLGITAENDSNTSEELLIC